MSDSSQRRGPFSAQRGPSRDSEDPLAELARLVSQGDAPRARPAASSGYALQPSTPPRASYTPPAVDRVQDRLEPLGYRNEPRAAYGSAQPTYSTKDDFFDDPPLAGSQNGYAQSSSYKSYDDDFEADYEDSYQARTYRDDFDEAEAAVYPALDDGDVQAAPERRRGGMKAVVALTSLAIVAGLGTWGYSSLGSGDATAEAPPFIGKDERPVKVVAEAKTSDKPLKDPARVMPLGDAKVGPGPEEPREKPAPRVILPGAPAEAGAESRVAEGGPSSSPPSAPSAQMPAAPTIPESDSTANASTANAPQSGSGPRVVRTLTIRPDGSAAPTALETASPVQAATPAPAPVDGMSLQQSPELGIMQNPSEAPPPPSTQTAYAPETVPLPLPRPDNMRSAPAPAQAEPPQARAATQVPAPSPPGLPPAAAGGPPSSPQPGVTVTNKRPLQPQGAVPAPRAQQRSSQTTPTSVRPVTAQAQPQQQAPRQVAMVGSPAPLAAPPPTAPQAAPVPQVATIATVSSSGGSGAFGVQLTAQRSEEEALAAFNALKQRHPQILGAYTPTVARADLGPDRGVFYRAMVPAQNQQDAANLCIQFKSQGVDCIVQRR
jgi:hypothetical protein